MSSSPPKKTSAPAKRPPATQPSLSDGDEGLFDELVGDGADEDAGAEAENKAEDARR